MPPPVYGQAVAIDFEGADPIYQQIAAIIRQRVADGVYKSNRAIPPEHDLVEEFGVARNTVRAAIRLLNEEGVLRTVRGRGTFVT